MTSSNKLYNSLMFIALVALPGTTALFLLLGGILEWPNVFVIGGSVALANLVVGAVLYMASANRKEDMDGHLFVSGHNEDTGFPNLQMIVTKDPRLIEKQPMARLKVTQSAQPQ